MVAVAVLFAILGRARAALLLTTGGYAIGLIGGAFVQLPYVVYPTLTLSAAASPPAVIQDFLITAVIGAPMVILAVAAWHVLSLRPSARPRFARPDERHMRRHAIRLRHLITKRSALSA